MVYKNQGALKMWAVFQLHNFYSTGFYDNMTGDFRWTNFSSCCYCCNGVDNFIIIMVIRIENLKDSDNNNNYYFKTL